MLTLDNQKQIESLIRTGQIVPSEVLEIAKLRALKENKGLMQVLLDMKALEEEDSVKLIAIAKKISFADLLHMDKPIDKHLAELIPLDVAKEYMAVPFGISNGALNVAMLDPTNLQAIDFISRKTGYPINSYIASQPGINHVLGMYAEHFSAEVSDVLKNIASAEKEESVAQKQVESDKGKVKDIVQDAPITRALNTILEYAISSRASDIHIEPRQKDLKIRFRIDGMLQEIMALPKSTEPALISRIKILSSLKIDEHRMTQDGQAIYMFENREVDLRIAIAPITYGEQVVIRILDKSAHQITLDTLGFHGRSLRMIESGMHKPHGLILSTGPTGSGKSTTLYAIVQAIRSGSINIVTLEDPVEYKMDGINQIQVNTAVGLTFANGLRSILRQDPNVVLVGEIRDSETADLAVQAALTGHTVLSTLHTNSAAGVLPRMLDMKIEPFLIASTINTVIGQRLVRSVCKKCIKGYPAPPSAIQIINKVIGKFLPKDPFDQKAKELDYGYKGLPLYSETAYTLYKGEGCPDCKEGYAGRIGIFEVFEMNSQMEKLLLNHATTTEIQDQAVRDGMLTMQEDGYLKALIGITTVEEVARVASDH
ncbi:MAG: GspE/PulE family protein [bacterium]